jgi:acetyltransferase-like isoleucine patch superfamily enzyme
MTPDRKLPSDWYDGTVPHNVVLDPTAYLESSYSFRAYRSQAPVGLRLGKAASAYLHVMFDVGPRGQVSLGDYTLFNGGRVICDSSIEIGNYCLISWNVLLMDTYRFPKNVAPRRAMLRQLSLEPRCITDDQATARPIRISRNVWIGFDSCVLPGVTIGEGAVVGARSVVAEDVPAFAVVAGNPARIIRHLDPGESPLAQSQQQASAL